jgi:hypothetical protein
MTKAPRALAIEAPRFSDHLRTGAVGLLGKLPMNAVHFVVVKLFSQAERYRSTRRHSVALDGCNPSPALDGCNPPSALDGCNPPSALDGCNPPSALDGCNPSPALDGCNPSLRIDNFAAAESCWVMTDQQDDPLAKFGLDAIDLRWTLKDIDSKRTWLINKDHLPKLIELA